MIGDLLSDWQEPSWALLCGDWTWPLTAQLLTAQIKRLTATGARAHVITDPPYGVATHEGVVRFKGGSFEGQPLSFAPIEPADLVPQLLAIEGLTGWVVAFCELEALGAYKLAAGKRWRRAGVAVRAHPQPQMTGDRPATGADGVAVMWGGRGRSVWSKGGHAAIWQLTTCRDPDRFHETQKPIAIMRDLILDFTAPGDLVIDPFCGSGATGVAALHAGRRFVGVEVQGQYATQAAGRLARHAEQAAQDGAAPPDLGRHARQGSLIE